METGGRRLMPPVINTLPLTGQSSTAFLHSQWINSANKANRTASQSSSGKPPEILRLYSGQILAMYFHHHYKRLPHTSDGWMVEDLLLCNSGRILVLYLHFHYTHQAAGFGDTFFCPTRDFPFLEGLLFWCTVKKHLMHMAILTMPVSAPSWELYFFQQPCRNQEDLQESFRSSSGPHT